MTIPNRASDAGPLATVDNNMTAEVQISAFPESKRFLTVSIGDRVRHWAGDTGTVVAIESRYAFMDEYPGGARAVYHTHIIVQADKRPRQRKVYPPASWDGIVEVL